MTVPTFLLTGFLGSGKTTTLRRLMQHGRLADTAVIINEFGQVGLDHLLVESGRDDVVVLDTGCVCCSLRSGLVETIRRLFARRRRGELPEFRRIVVETTGLAEPIPILQSFAGDPGLQKHTRLEAVLATVDAATGVATLDRHAEAVAQVAVADRIIVTKPDLVDRDTLEAVEARIVSLNPHAPRRRATQGDIAPEFVLAPADASEPVLARAAPASAGHHAGIASFHVTFDAPLHSDIVYQWLEMLLSLTAGDVLRIKGVVNLIGCDEPVVIHGVQHLVHAPQRLAGWPGDDRRSHIVLITRDIDSAVVESALQILDVPAALETATAH